jgi:hypothetical protein
VLPGGRKRPTRWRSERTPHQAQIDFNSLHFDSRRSPLLFQAVVPNPVPGRSGILFTDDGTLDGNLRRLAGCGCGSPAMKPGISGIRGGWEPGDPGSRRAGTGRTGSRSRSRSGDGSWRSVRTARSEVGARRVLFSHHQQPFQSHRIELAGSTPHSQAVRQRVASGLLRVCRCGIIVAQRVKWSDWRSAILSDRPTTVQATRWWRLTSFSWILRSWAAALSWAMSTAA